MDEVLAQIQRWLQRGDGGLVGGQGVMLGVDIGSYGLRAILADMQGVKIERAQRPLPDGDAEGITEAGIALAQDLIARTETEARQLVRIGIGFGGPVDADAGRTRVHYRRPGWESFPLAERWEAVFDAPVVLDNDARVIAQGEACCVEGRDVQNLFYLHLSSGVGGGMVIDGRLYHGATSTAGEIGHTIVRRNGPPCSCGGQGHLESFVSVRALLRRLNELGVETNELAQVFGNSEAARQTVDEATTLLAPVLANVTTLVDPQIIVVGGVVARTGGAAWIERLQNEVRRTLPPTLAHPIPIVSSAFHQDSVAVGALALAMASLQE